MEPPILRFRTNTDCNTDMNKADEVKKFDPFTLCHKPSESPLSSFPGYNYSGVLNFALVILIGAGASQLIESFNMYGPLIDPGRWWFLLSGTKNGFLESYLLFFLLYSPLPAAISLLLEQAIAQNKIPENIGIKCHIVNLIHVVLVPIVVITQIYSKFTVAGSAYVSFLYTAQFLKLWSYAQVNYWSRKHGTSKTSLKNDSKSKRSTEKDLQVHYPDNLTWKDAVYFFFAPTLSYELNFPRTEKIQKRFLLRSLLEIVLLLPIMLCVSQQWLAPYAIEYVSCFYNNGGLMKRTEFILKAVIPMNLIWAMLFYMIFQSYLNILAELLYFADRTFYQDWWNASNLEVHWRKWNTRCHVWGFRHVYIPLAKLGYSKHIGKLAVWGISAFFHEYVFCLTLGTFDLGYFFSLLFQGQMASFTKMIEKYVGQRFASLLILSMNVLGSPSFIMFSYYQYILSNNLESTVISTAEKTF